MDTTIEKILTISIAAYNVESTLKRALDSMPLNEDGADKIEVVVVNDGSSDETLNIADEYAYKYPNIVRVIDKPNGGYGSTINESSKVAKGKYYRLLDGDDWYIKENVLDFVKYLETCDSDIVFSPFYEINETDGSKRLVSHHDRISDKCTDIEKVVFKGDVFMHGLTIKTDLWNKSGFTVSEHCFYTDNEFVANALMNAKTISRYEEPIYCYALGVCGQSVSKEGIMKNYHDYVIVAKKLLDLTAQVSACDIVKDIVDNKIIGVCNTAFTAYLNLEESKKNKEELMDFDNHIRKTNVDIYRKLGRVKKIAVSRAIGFLGYGIACKYFKTKE